MNKHLARFGEVFLKGKNRGLFIRKLKSNIESQTGGKVRQIHQRLLVEVENGDKLKRVFGLVNYSTVEETPLDIELITQKAIELCNMKTFRVNVKRITKTIPQKSPELEREIGAKIAETGKQVNLHKPEQIITIEIINDKAYVANKTIKCVGGLPVGIEGKVKVLMRSDKDVLAALQMMKRGCEVIMNKQVPLLEKYMPDKSKKNEKTQVLVLGETMDDYTEHEKPVLRPLITYTKKEIKERLEYYENL